MKISPKTKKLVDKLNEYSGGKLKNIKELSCLIEIAEVSGKDKLFYDIQFAAKYLNGLGKILQSNVSLTPNKNTGGNGTPPPSAEEARAKIMEEYKNNMTKLTSYLSELLSDADSDIKKEIEEKFLSLTRTSLVNLTTLVYDLSWLKRYNNSRRT